MLEAMEEVHLLVLFLLVVEVEGAQAIHQALVVVQVPLELILVAVVILEVLLEVLLAEQVLAVLAVVLHKVLAAMQSQEVEVAQEDQAPMPQRRVVLVKV